MSSEDLEIRRQNRRLRTFSDSLSDTEMTPLLPHPEEAYWIPKRFVFSTMAFVACCLNVSYNMNLSVAIVAMINRTEEADFLRHGNVVIHQSGSFNWSPETEGIALGALYYGQLVSFIPGGRMAELYGGKKMLIICTFIAAAFTTLSPAAAYCHEYAFIAARFLVGIGTGPIIPIVFYMLTRWIPVTERGFHASFIISGYGVGSFLEVIVSGALCDFSFLGGWPSVFYTGGIAGMLWCLMGISIMYELPDDHPTISREEIACIIRGLEREKHAKIKSIPWKQMAISVPLWALAFGFFGQFWLLAFFSTVHAIYMGTVLKLPIVKTGVLSCLPHLLRAIATCVASYPVDIMLKKKIVTVGFVRKGATVINTVVSCLAFLGITMVGRNVMATTVLFVFGGVLGEFVTFGVCLACTDIAPSLSGTVSGIINIVGVFPFFIVPALAGSLTNYQGSLRKWKNVFYVTIAVAIITTLIFVIFGDLNPQPWGTPAPPKAKKKKQSKEEEECSKSNSTKSSLSGQISNTITSTESIT